MSNEKTRIILIQLNRKEYPEAYQYLAMCAFVGYPVSLYKIGDMYRNGHYVRQERC